MRLKKPGLRVDEAHGLFFAQEAVHHVLVGLGHIGALHGTAGTPWLEACSTVSDSGITPISSMRRMDVLQRQHLAVFHAVGVVAGDQQVLLDRLALDGALGLGAEHAQDAVRVAHRGDLGVGHHQRLVGVVHGHQRAAFDAGGRVADDVFKVHGRQIVQHLSDAVLRQRFLVASARPPARTGSRTACP
jgi:hypothetical protein